MPDPWLQGKSGRWGACRQASLPTDPAPPRRTVCAPGAMSLHSPADHTERSLIRRSSAAVLALTILGLVGPARADEIPDTTDDFLLTYTGPHDPGLDVVAHEVTFAGDRLIFYGRMAGPIAPTQAIGGLYLFGLDRGQGTPRFLAGAPVI